MKATDLWTIQPLADPKAIVKGPGYRITVLTPRLLRLEYEPEDRFLDSATQLALNRAFPVPEYTVRADGSRILLETEALSLSYDGKPFSPGGLFATLKGSRTAHPDVWVYGSWTENLGGTVRTLDGVNGAISLGDGIMSRAGYTVLDDSHSMRMDESGRLLPAVDHGTDLYLFAYGFDYQACLRDYLFLSGPVPPLPRFALGNWWSRYYRYTQAEYLALMDRFRQEDIPLSVAVLDMNWHVTDIDPAYGSGWTGYTWDRELIPDPEALLSQLHDRSLMVLLNDHPWGGIRPFDDLHAAMARALGDDPGEGKSYPFDAADESFLQAFENVVLKSLENTGVDAWWIDWQQPGGSSDAGVEPLFVLNHTRYLHAVREGKPPLILSRYAGPGSHRYPVGFSGDTFATWESLAFQPFFTATAANIAYGWWSHDIGGHMGGKTDPELSLRWLQFGVFSPILRLHSTLNPFMDKAPWAFPPEIGDRMKNFLRLRHRLIPWLYTRAMLASARREMLLRPVYYEDPSGDALFHARQEYLLGDALLVAPVTQPADRETGLGAVEVYLPEGGWTDFFTGIRYTGGRRLKMFRGLDSLPVLVRDGAILPLDAEESLSNGAPLPRHLLIRVFPGADGETELLEDNGRHPADPAYRLVRTRIRIRRENGLTVTVDPPEGDASLIPEGRCLSIEMNGFPDLLPEETVLIESHEYCAGRRALTLRINREAASAGLRLHWHELPAAPELNRLERLKDLLTPAAIPYDLKPEIMKAAGNLPDRVEFLAQLKLMSIPDALYEAVLELLSSC